MEKRAATLPKTLTNVIKCKNPRCITNGEQELDQIFGGTVDASGIKTFLNWVYNFARV